MRKPFFRKAAPIIACVALFLGGCSNAKLNLDSLWPLSGGKEQDLSRAPTGSTAYTCEDGSRLFVRYLDNGAAAWVILPGREFRLNKAASGSRYSNGSATLDIKDKVLTLFDGAKPTHSGCKAAGAQ